MKKLNRKCAICGNHYGNVLHHIKMVLPKQYPIPDEYDVVSCADCGFTYADVDSCQAEYDRYYSNCNMYSASNDLLDGLPEHITKSRLDFFRKHIDRQMNILDVGFGGGDFLRTLRRDGYLNVSGFDPSEDSVESLRNVDPSIQCEVGSIFAEPIEKWIGKFDCVCFLTVMEHIYDLKDVIMRLKQYLRPDGGQIFLDVPDVEGYPQYFHVIPHYFNQEHINHFSLVSLDNLFIKNGFVRVSDKGDSRIVVGQDTPEASLQALYKISQVESASIKKDNISHASIMAYFNKAEEIGVDKEKIREFISGYESIAIWGVGSYCMQILENIPEVQDKIDFFVDNNKTKWGMEILDKKVYPPSYLLNKEKTAVLICVMRNAEHIVSQMKNCNIRNDHIVCR